MSGIRRALFFSSGERYIGMLVGFASVAAVSRLLTPTEIGTAAIGTALIAISISLKEFAASGFLIQGKEATAVDVRTAFTVQFGLTLLIAGALLLLAPYFAAFYREPRLAAFVEVVAIALLIDTFAAPITSLLRRELAFGILATINIASLSVSAVVTIGLAAAGFSFMSLAWAWPAATLTTVVLSLSYRPHIWMYRPTLASWRRAVAFGRYNGAMTVLNRLYEGLPQMVLGRILPLEAVGLYNRAMVVSNIPDKFLLAGVFNVAFPALAVEVRAGRSLEQPLLKAYCYITVFYWPALILLGLLAYPLVRLALGDQWSAAVPLVQIIALASLSWFPGVLNQPVLLALGAMRDAFLANLVALPISAVVLSAASSFGVEAMAASQLFTTPFQVLVALAFIRRHVPFGWLEMAAALRSSALVTLCSVVPVVAVIALAGFELDLSIGLAAVAGGLGACGWMIGIRLTRHPVGLEIHRAAEALGGPPSTARLVGRLLAVNPG